MQAFPVLQLGHSEYILRIEFALDGARIVTLDVAGVLKLWDTETGRLLRNIVEDGATSAPSEEFMTISSDGSIILLQRSSGGTAAFDAVAGRRFAECPDHHLISATATNNAILCPVPEKNEVWIFDLVQNTFVQTLIGPRRHHKFYGRLAISSDGRFVAAPTSQNAMIVWNRETTEVIADFQIPVNDASVEPMFSRDGKLLAFGTAMDPVVVVDLETLKFSRSFGGAGEVERFWLSPSGDRLATFMNNAVATWDLEGGQQQLDSEDVERSDSDDEVMEYSFPEEAAACFQEHRTLFAWSDGNELYVDNLSDKSHLWKAPPPPACPFGYQLNVSPNGKFLLRNSAQMIEAEHDLVQHLTFWDITSLEPIRSDPVEGDGFVGICPFPDGQTYLVAADGVLQKRRWSDGQLVEELDAWLQSVMDIALTPDGQRLVATGLGRVPYSINVESGEVDLKFRKSVWTRIQASLARMLHLDPFEALAASGEIPGYSPVVQHLLAVSEPHNLLISSARHSGLCTWSLSTGRSIDRISLRGRFCTALATSPDGRYLAAAYGNDIVLYALPHLQELVTLSGHTNLVQALRFSDQSDTVLSGGMDSTLRLWRPSDGTPLQTMQGHEGPVGAVTFIPGGRAAVSAGNDATFRFWELATGNLLRTIYDPTPTDYVCLTTDGKYAATPDGESALAFTVVDDDGCRSVPASEFDSIEGRKLDSLGLF